MGGAEAEVVGGEVAEGAVADVEGGEAGGQKQQALADAQVHGGAGAAQVEEGEVHFGGALGLGLEDDGAVLLDPAWDEAQGLCGGEGGAEGLTFPGLQPGR